MRRAALLIALLAPLGAHAQALDLSHGGPIGITASDGIEWRQEQKEVIATGNARAVRDNVTVTADRLIAWYRKKTADAAAKPASDVLADTDTAGNEIYRLQAQGHVRIFTKTDEAQGDVATYDLDQAVMVMTGRDLKLTTPNDILTARDALEYWPQKRMAVARGDAVVLTKDGKRIAADTLVAYTAPNEPAATKTAAASGAADEDPLGASGKLEKVEAFGHVSVRTVTDTVTGDRAVYAADSEIARVGGNVRITRGQNQLNGAEADVNMKTGVARLVAGRSDRVQGLVVPNDQTNQSLTAQPGAPGAKP